MNGVVFHTSVRMMVTNEPMRPAERVGAAEEAGVGLDGEAEGEGRDHRDDPVGDEDRRAHRAPAEHRPVHDQGEGEADDQLDDHARRP